VTRTTLTAVGAALTLFVAVPSASAAPAATATATNSCWLDVINDWLDNSRVDKTYPVPCYTHAIQQLNTYPDVQNYSSAADDIHRALLAAIHDRGSGGGSRPPSGPSSGPSSAPPSNDPQPNPISSIFNSGRPGNAQSIPLPLLVLGGLAALLLLSAIGTWVVRRLQARRVSPVPAPAVDKRG